MVRQKSSREHTPAHGRAFPVLQWWGYMQRSYELSLGIRHYSHCFMCKKMLVHRMGKCQWNKYLNLCNWLIARYQRQEAFRMFASSRGSRFYRTLQIWTDPPNLLWALTIGSSIISQSSSWSSAGPSGAWKAPEQSPMIHQSDQENFGLPRDCLCSSANSPHCSVSPTVWFDRY